MGAMMMREAGEITRPADETASQEPDGYHIMLLDIATPLELFEVTLTFENGGEQAVAVEVRAESP